MPENTYSGSRRIIYRESFLPASSRRLLCLVIAALIVCLAACGGSSKTVPPVPGPQPGTAQHLYINGATGHALQFALPLSGSSPSATLSLATASDVSAL